MHPTRGRLLTAVSCRSDSWLTLDWAETSHRDAGEPDDVIQIKSVRVEPDPPVPGQKMTVYADGLATQRIEVGLGNP